MKDPLNYTLGDQLNPEASSCKYLGIILRSDLNRADLANHTVKKGVEGTTFHNAHTQKGE